MRIYGRGNRGFFYNLDNGGLFFDSDGIGDTASIQIAELRDSPELTFGDIQPTFGSPIDEGQKKHKFRRMSQALQVANYTESGNSK